jgi:hypothetical protein
MPVNVEKTIVTVGTTDINLETLPARSVSTLLSRGLTHYFGNEIASKIAGWTKKQEVEPSADDVAVEKSRLFAEALAKLEAGTVGQRATAVSIDPIDKIRYKIAKQQVVDILHGIGVKPPKGDEKVTFADGTQKSLDEMIARRLEVNGDEIEKAAKKILAERERAVKVAKTLGEAAEAKTADALGL